MKNNYEDRLRSEGANSGLAKNALQHHRLVQKRFVALTRHLFESMAILDVDLATGVIDNSLVMKCFGDRGHRRTSHAKHFCQKFLGKGDRIAVCSV